MSALQVEFVDFEDEPRQTTAALTTEFAEVLRNNPGRWAKWPIEMAGDSARTRAADINNDRDCGCPKALRGGAFQARTQRGTLFVRYVGVQQ